MATGANHPVFGTTKIWPGVWYHAAATYNGVTKTAVLTVKKLL